MDFKIGRKIAEDVHRQVADLPAELPRHIKNEQAIDARLVLRQRDGVGYERRTALVMNIKRVAIAGVVVDRRRDLEEEVVFWKRQPRSALPRQKKRICVRDQLISSNPADLCRSRRAWSKRIFRIRVVV